MFGSAREIQTFDKRRVYAAYALCKTAACPMQRKRAQTHIIIDYIFFATRAGRQITICSSSSSGLCSFAQLVVEDPPSTRMRMRERIETPPTESFGMTRKRWRKPVCGIETVASRISCPKWRRKRQSFSSRCRRSTGIGIISPRIIIKYHKRTVLQQWFTASTKF